MLFLSTTENRKEGNRMKKRKWMAATGVILGLGMMMTGCTKTQESASALEVQEISMEEEEQTDQEADEAEEEEPRTQEADETAEEEQTGQKIDIAEEEEHLGGKVQNPSADGMTLAQTTVMEGSSVILLEEKDAEKIPVQFTADTRVERWTIQGGGANIDMQAAAVSDLKAGMGVELMGRFEGGTFVASKVIIEEDS